VTPVAIIRQLAVTPDAVRALAALPPELIAVRPDSERWSVLEVLCHLADEEQRDFRPRLRSTLERPEATWKPIDPPSWVPGYVGRDPGEALADFEAERRDSLEWLSGLGDPDWEREHVDAARGRRMRAIDLLRSWLAHDYHHLRQLTVIRYDLLRAAGGSLAYAGDW
jgi:uncharacterized damage-inducible protein DinB